MTDVLIMRAAFLNATIQFYRRLGTPVERELARAGLPRDITDLHNSYVSANLATRFRNSCSALERVPDASWHIYGSYHLQMLNSRFANIANQSVTLFDRLTRLLATAQLESSFVQITLKQTLSGFDVVYNRPPPISFDQEPVLWEWNRVMAMVTLIQSGAGPSWRPKKIGFVSPFQPCDEANEYFHDTEILFNQPGTFVSIPRDVLARPLATRPTAERCPDLRESPEVYGDQGQTKGLDHLRAALQPYVSEGRGLNLALAAEIAGKSPRSLQRWLKKEGVSFADIRDQCRFDRAIRLLTDPHLKMIDIAIDVGYDDPAHFSRAFRRISGVSPRQYRADLEMSVLH